jgi:hypothetical protein
MDQCLGVAIRVKAMTLGDQIGPKRLIVVDFSIEDDPYSAVLIRNRLVARAQINDAEAAHADRNLPLDMEAFIVGTAMNNRVAHRLYHR